MGIGLQEQEVGYFYNDLGQLEFKKYYAADASPGDHANSNYPNSPAETVEFTYDNLAGKRLR